MYKASVNLLSLEARPWADTYDVKLGKRPKCVHESDFVGKARNSCFCDQNMQIIDSRVYFK